MEELAVAEQDSEIGESLPFVTIFADGGIK